MRNTTSNPSSSAADPYDPKDKAVLQHARPNWHSLTYVLSMTTFCSYQCYTAVDKIDEVAILETWTRRVFPSLLSLKALGWIRIAIAISIWATMYETVTSEGWIQTTVYNPRSRLQRGVQLHMKGVRTLFPFTSWCWILLGVSFSCHGGLALAVEYIGEDFVLEFLQASPWILRSLLLIWQTTAPCAFLVSSVIRYAIWDVVLNGPGTTDGLKHFRNIMSHNANSVFVLAEVALLGGLPVRLSEMYLGPLYGSAYIWMAWSLTDFWAPKKCGPHFIYFFLDTTRGWSSTAALVALTSVVTLFHFILAVSKVGLDHISQYFESEDSLGRLVCHVAFVLGIASLVVRFRD